MNGHTPGPWHAPLNTGCTTGLVWAEEPHGGIVATVPLAGLPLPDSAQLTANARLIAAAPEMLAALERLIDVVGEEDVASIEAVIAKAKGESE